MRRGAWAAVAASVYLSAAPAWAGDFYMLDTEEARTVGEGNLRTEVQVGVRKQNDASELYNVPRVRAEYGVGEWADLEFEYEGLIVEDTDIPNFDTIPTTVNFNEDEGGGGDLRIRLKLVPWNFTYGDVGVLFETKLPNADEDDGLGTDGTDFTAKVLHSVEWSRFTDAPVLRDVTSHVNAGIAINAQPSRNREQEDYFVWGVAAQYPLTDVFTIMGEVEGALEGSATRNIAEGSESDGSVMARLAVTGAINEDWTVGVSGAKGLTDDSQDWEVQLGVSRTWGIGYQRPAARNASPEMRLIDPERPGSYFNPLWTEEAQVIGPRRFRGELSFGYVNQADDSDLYTIPKAVVGWGIGEWADLELDYEFLSVHDTDVVRNGMVVALNETSTETGDVRVHVKLVPLRLRIGDAGIKFTTKLPNASDEQGLGTDETDFITRLMLSSNWGAISSNAFVSRLTTHVNVGFTIQEDPVRRASQDDIFIWGAAAEYAVNDEWTLWAEIHGAHGGEEVDNIGEGDYGDKQLVARAGVTGPLPNLDILPDYDLFRDWKWSATVGAGLTSESPEYTGQLGFSHTWGLE